MVFLYSRVLLFTIFSFFFLDNTFRPPDDSNSLVNKHGHHFPRETLRDRDITKWIESLNSVAYQFAAIVDYNIINLFREKMNL